MLGSVVIQNAHPGGPCVCSQHFYFGAQVCYIRAHIALADREIRNSGIVPGLQAHRLPNAARHKLGSPIPAVFIGCLADVGFVLGQ